MRTFDFFDEDDASQLVRHVTEAYAQKLLEAEGMGITTEPPESIAQKVGAFTRTLCAELEKEIPNKP